MDGEKAWRQLHKNAGRIIEQVPEGNTTESSSYTATYLPSRKLSKLDEPDTQDSTGEAGTSSYGMFSYGTLHMAVQKQRDQLEPT